MPAYAPLPGSIFMFSPANSVWNSKSRLPWISPFERKEATILPPISSLESQVESQSAPHDLPPTYSPLISRLPSMSTNDPPLFTESTLAIDWIDFSRTRSAQFIAEKTCEMICYLWFQPSPNHNRRAPVSTLQLVATPAFVHFMQKLLETTQVSQSVIVLSLRYIYDLKRRNPAAAGQPGSEFRVAVAALLLANKFLDDNTYTNRTWSDVSGIDLNEINAMESEFLRGVNYSLYVQQTAYESWLNLLKGLGMAKESDSRRLLRRTRTPVRQARHPPARTYHSQYRPTAHRARSTSPSQTTRVEMSVAEAPVQVGFKRSADVAFSPIAATFSQRSAKRSSIPALTIPETVGSSYSPLEGLHGFAEMSLAGGGGDSLGYARSQRDSIPETLVTGYTLDGRRNDVPQNLYFYTLSCSPSEPTASATYTSDQNTSELYDNRKGRLRYHQPPPPSSYDYYTSSPGRFLLSPATTAHPLPPSFSLSQYHYTNPHHAQPGYVQSASTSPIQPQEQTQLLPQLNDLEWTTPAPAYQQEEAGRTASEAPFANAGPPGVYFYPTSGGWAGR